MCNSWVTADKIQVTILINEKEVRIIDFWKKNDVFQIHICRNLRLVCHAKYICHKYKWFHSLPVPSVVEALENEFIHKYEILASFFFVAWSFTKLQKTRALSLQQKPEQWSN